MQAPGWLYVCLCTELGHELKLSICWSASLSQGLQGCGRDGSCQMSCEGEAWKGVPKPALFYGAEHQQGGLKGGQKRCFPKDLINYRAGAPVYSQDVYRRKTTKRSKAVRCVFRSPAAFVHATQPVFGLEGANRLSRWGKSWPGGDLGDLKHEPQP